MDPLVSIVVPVYNSEKYIDKGIECLLAQSYKHIEIICVDNNSTDNSLGILKTWEQKCSYLKVIEEKKQGAPCARNLGTLAATGEWIQYFDIDDYLYPGKIEHQINLLKNSTGNPVIVFEGWEVVKLNGEKTQYEVLDDVWKAMFNGRIGHTNSVLIKKSKVLEVGGWDERLKSSQERDLYFRILKTDPTYVISKNFGSVFRMREGSITTSTGNVKGNTLRFVQLRQHVLDFIMENKPEYYRENKRWYLSLFLEMLRWIYKYDPEISVRLYSTYCKSEQLEPVGSLNKKYLGMLKIVGFKITEKLYSVFQHLKS